MRRRIGNVFLLAGGAALVWCLTALVGAALFQWYQGRKLVQSVAVRKAPHVPAMHEVIGRLEIPRLHLSTVVLEGDDTGVLRFGAGHVPGTAFPFQTGNFSVAAHRDSYFRPLRKIRPQDRIELTTPEGLYIYAVESTEIVKPDDTRVLNAHGGQELTLITCYPFYYVGSAPLRFIVHARRVA